MVNENGLEEKKYKGAKIFKGIVGAGALMLALIAFYNIGDIVLNSSTIEDLIAAKYFFAILVIYVVFYWDTIKKILKKDNGGYTIDNSHNMLRYFVVGSTAVYIAKVIFVILETYKWYSQSFNEIIWMGIVLIGLYIALGVRTIKKTEIGGK